MWRFLSICAFVSLACALPQPSIDTENTHNTFNVENKLETGRSITKECSGGIFSPTCLKLEAISVIEKLSAKEELKLLPGVSVIKETNENGSKAEEVAAEIARSMPGKPEERLDKYLLYRLGSYLDTHSVKLRLMDDGAADEAKQALGEARKSALGGKKGGMGGLIAAAMMMKGIIRHFMDIPAPKACVDTLVCTNSDLPRGRVFLCEGTLMSIGLGGLAMLAGKALMTAMMSLLLSAIIGLKSLTSGGKSTTYEIVSKPVYSHSHSHSTGHEDLGYGHSGH